MNVARIVKELQRATGKNQTGLAKALGVSQPTVSRWLKNVKPESDHNEVILNYAREIGVIKPTDNSSGTIPVVGYVGAGGAILYEEGQGPFGEAPMPPGGARQETVAVVVRGDSMAGQLEDGWTVYYDDRRDPPTDDLLGKLCVLGLQDGRVLIKRLVRGRDRGHFDLYSAAGGVLLDQLVTWAARVTWIRVD